MRMTRVREKLNHVALEMQPTSVAPYRRILPDELIIGCLKEHGHSLPFGTRTGVPIENPAAVGREGLTLRPQRFLITSWLGRLVLLFQGIRTTWCTEGICVRRCFSRRMTGGFAWRCWGSVRRARGLRSGLIA